MSRVGLTALCNGRVHTVKHQKQSRYQWTTLLITIHPMNDKTYHTHGMAKIDVPPLSGAWIKQWILLGDRNFYFNLGLSFKGMHNRQLNKPNKSH